MLTWRERTLGKLWCASLIRNGPLCCSCTCFDPSGSERAAADKSRAEADLARQHRLAEKDRIRAERRTRRDQQKSDRRKAVRQAKRSKKGGNKGGHGAGEKDTVADGQAQNGQAAAGGEPDAAGAQQPATGPGGGQ